MSELKTKPTKQSAKEFLNKIEPEEKRKDSLVLLAMFQKITGERPVMWGTSIIGFGMYHYKSERSKQEGDWPLTGFSPRKANLTIYIMAGFGQSKKLLAKIGKHKISGGSCLYVKRLADIDIKVLKELIKVNVKYMREKHGV